MPTQTLTLTEFLLARFAEDEALLRPGGWFADPFNPPRLLAECEAKRGVVEDLTRFLSLAVAAGAADDHPTLLAGLTLQLQRLALPYADHPDYRDEWRP